MKDYYDILGVSSEASDAEIKTAYKKLAKKFHPDRNQGSRTSEDKFKEISEAYDVLSDGPKRKRYDALRRMRTGEASRMGETYDDGLRFEFAELFRDSVFGGRGGRSYGSGTTFSELLDEMFFGSEKNDGPKPGHQDVYAEISVPFLKAVNGGEVEFSYVQGARQTLKVKIPAGIEDGRQLRLKGLGKSGPGDSGDLLLTVRVQPDETFTRKGLDIHCDLNINIAQAVFGSTARIRTVYGDRIDVKIPPSTQSGTIFKLARLGIRAGDSVGDMFVVARLMVPNNMSRHQKELLKSFAESCGLEW